MWFNHVGGHDWRKWRFDELFAMMYQHQPELIINDRAARFCGPKQPGDLRRPAAEIEKMTAGDFGTPEETVGRIDLKHDWESCMTLAGNQWSWKPGAKIRSLDEVLRILVSCATGGGTCCWTSARHRPVSSSRSKSKCSRRSATGSNRGPKRSTAPVAARCAGDGVIGSTHRDNKLYLFLSRSGVDSGRDSMQSRDLHIPTLSSKIVSAARLVDGKPISFKTTEGGTTLAYHELASGQDSFCEIIEITLDKPIADGTLLPAK